jgi:hypothetical protein
MTRLVVAAVVLASGSCGAPNLDVVFHSVQGHHFSWSERRTIERIADRTVEEVRQTLPQLPRDLILRVQAARAGDTRTERTGASGESTSSVVYWTVDPNRSEGVTKIADTWLRETLIHEYCHMVRHEAVGLDAELLDRIVTHGLARALKREFDGVSAPAAEQTEDAVAKWVADLVALPDDEETRNDWLDRQSDWRLVYNKVGDYFVDQAGRVSGLSVIDLMSTPTADVVRLAFDATTAGR